MAICELMCWGILLRDLERKNDRHHDFFALQNLSVVPYCPDSSWLSRLRIPGTPHITLWSYSLYLSHKAIGHIVGTQLHALDTPKWAVLGAVTVSCLLAAAALFNVVESPFMKMRRRFFPSSFREGMAGEKV